MAWFVPIGVFEGVKLTSEITNSTIDLTPDGEIEHSVIRTGAGSVPLPPEYGQLLSFLSSEAPADAYLSQWFGKQPDPGEVVKQFEELAEHGLVMSFGEHPLTDARVASRVVRKVGGVRRVDDDAAAESSDLEAIEAGDDAEVLVNKYLLEVLEGQPPITSVANLFGAFANVVPEAEKKYADQVFESGLQALIQSGAVQVVVPD